MEKVSIDDLRNRADSVYRLVLVAARRARELQAELSRSHGSDHDKPTVAALREVASGKVSYKPWPESEEKAKKKKAS